MSDIHADIFFEQLSCDNNKEHVPAPKKSKAIL